MTSIRRSFPPDRCGRPASAEGALAGRSSLLSFDHYQLKRAALIFAGAPPVYRFTAAEIANAKAAASYASRFATLLPLTTAHGADDGTDL